MCDQIYQAFYLYFLYFFCSNASARLSRIYLTGLFLIKGTASSHMLHRRRQHRHNAAVYPTVCVPIWQNSGAPAPLPPTVWNTKASFSGHSQWCSGMSVPRYYCLKDTFWVFISSFYKCQLYIFDLSPLNACLLPSISIHSMLWILSSLVTQPFFFGIQVNWETSLPNVGFELSKKRNRLQK